MSQTIILITGANRGLGRGLLQRYLVKPNHTVIALNRDPSSSTSISLFSLPTGTGSKLIILKTDARVESDALEAVKQLISQGITYIDVVIANAGVHSGIYPKVSEIKTEDWIYNFTPNVFGVVYLYQATLPLLLKAAAPKWITIGSIAGALENQMPFPNATYSTSKTVAHWITKRIDGEEEKLAAFVISPGWVQTDMGNLGAIYFGMKEADVRVEDSCNGMVTVIDGATKTSHGGRLWNYTGEQMAW